jgi:hypothetical protein
MRTRYIVHGNALLLRYINIIVYLLKGRLR